MSDWGKYLQIIRQRGSAPESWLRCFLLRCDEFVLQGNTVPASGRTDDPDTCNLLSLRTA